MEPLPSIALLLRRSESRTQRSTAIVRSPHARDRADPGSDATKAAKKEFRLKFKECAKSEFEFTVPPCQANGGYQVQLLAGQSGQDAAEAARKAGRATAAAAAASSGPACTLTPEVQQFVELIYSEKLMKLSC